MTDKAQKLITDFKVNGWQTEKLYERLFDLTSDSEDTFHFASEFLKSFDDNATIFNDILSYIDESQFRNLIHLSLDILKKQENENAASVIAHASLQFPELLQNDLESIFELKPNESTYYAEYPWRNLNSDKIQIFKTKLIDAETTINDKQKLFRCLLQTRNIESIKFAYGYAFDNKLFQSDDLEGYLIAQLELVGFTKRDGNIENYCPNIPYHFNFKKSYFSDDRPIHLNKEQHPTWNLKSHESNYKFGGILQIDERNPFTHLITFDKIPDGLNISELTTLTLGLHIREVNEYGAVFYQHDKLGNPTKIGDEQEIEVYSDLPIKETEISFTNTPNRWKFQDWGNSNSRENLFRFGGEPTWIQSAEVLVCPISGEKMDFLMQLDTELPDIGNGEVYFGSGGICYVFWCDKTKVSGYLMQCT